MIYIKLIFIGFPLLLLAGIGQWISGVGSGVVKWAKHTMDGMDWSELR